MSRLERLTKHFKAMALGNIHPDAEGHWSIGTKSLKEKPSKTPSLTLVTPTQQGVEQAKDEKKKRKRSDSQGSAQKRRKLKPTNQKKAGGTSIKGPAKKKKAQTSVSHQASKTKPQKKKAAVKKANQQKKKASVKTSKLANLPTIFNGGSQR